MYSFKKIILLILILSLTVFAVAGLTACLGDDEEPDDESENPYPEDDEPLDGLILIRKNVAQFKVVIASGAGGDGRRAATNLVAALKELGVEISDAIDDKDASLVTDCEIIIGTGVKNRPSNCNVEAQYLGDEGYTIKTVGSRVIIAGGTAALTRSAVETFTEKYLGITDSTESLRNVSVAENLKVEVLTKYEIDSLKIGTLDISRFVIACNKNDYNVYPSLVSGLQSTIVNLVGKRLDIVDISDTTAKQNKIVIRSIPYSVDADGNRTYEDGFYAYVDSGSLIVECEYSNAFKDSFDKFFKEYVTSKKGNVVIPETLDYSEHVSTVSYCGYGGAVGDGETNDFLAMLATHEYANQGGQKVIADPGKVFYIGVTDGIEIPIMTDCDFGTQVHEAGDKCAFGVSTDDPKLYMDEANFIIDDTIAEIYPYSANHIFKLVRDDGSFSLKATQLEEIGLKSDIFVENEVEKTIYVKEDGSKIVAKGATSIPWIKDYITERSMIILYNLSKRDYVRFGANQNSGSIRRDFVIVDEEGNIDPSTPVIFDFYALSTVSVVPLDDTPITINGGHFKTLANQAIKEITHWLNGVQVTYTDYRNVYHEYGRGFKISRANVTMTNVRHKIEGEADPGYNSATGYATTGCGYPYYGFFLFDGANSVDIVDCDLTGHTVYFEDKSQFTNSSGTSSSAVAMGTYDFVVEYSNDISFTGLEMRGVDIGDGSYWGIMSSNGSKNLCFTDCKISRIDAHRGFWNMKVENTVIGQLFNVIGGGKLEVINTQRRVGDRFLRLRGDYGSTFEGNMIITNCLLDGIQSFSSKAGGVRNDNSRYSKGYIIFSDAANDSNSAKNEAGQKDPTVYYKWDFGYTCYLPTTVTIENFVSRVTGTTYIFNDVQNGHFNTQGDTSPYVLTDSVKLISNSRNLPAFLKSGETCDTLDLAIAPEGSNCSTIRGVPVTKEEK